MKFISPAPLPHFNSLWRLNISLWVCKTTAAPFLNKVRNKIFVWWYVLALVSSLGPFFTHSCFCRYVKGKVEGFYHAEGSREASLLSVYFNKNCYVSRVVNRIDGLNSNSVIFTVL